MCLCSEGRLKGVLALSSEPSTRGGAGAGAGGGPRAAGMQDGVWAGKSPHSLPPAHCSAVTLPLAGIQFTKELLWVISGTQVAGEVEERTYHLYFTGGETEDFQPPSPVFLRAFGQFALSVHSHASPLQPPAPAL